MDLAMQATAKTYLANMLTDAAISGPNLSPEVVDQLAGSMAFWGVEDAHWERRVNEHGTAVRRLVLITAWEVDPDGSTVVAETAREAG